MDTGADINIIFYFENVAFFHAKFGSDLCPNQTFGKTLQDLARPVIHPWELEQVFGGGMPLQPFPTNQMG